jgi:hypothetical protein
MLTLITRSSDDVCRPYGTRLCIACYPALKRWANFLLPLRGVERSSLRAVPARAGFIPVTRY